MTPGEPTSDVAERISAEIAGIHKESYGEEVQGVTTYLLDDVVLCVLDIKLLVHERTLQADGRGAESILTVRKEFQESVGATFIAAVEHMTGRRVVGFISDTHLDPPFTIELFRLAPPSTEMPEAPAT